MSPGIGLTVPLVRSIERRAPRLALLAAVQQARNEGIPLRFGDLGAVRGPSSKPWVIDRRTVPRGVNLIGLILVLIQPVPGDETEDPSVTAARQFGVKLTWVEGAADGWDMEAMNQHWLKVDRGEYLRGYEAGAEARFAATLVCGECGSRRFRDETTCPGCDR